AIVGPVVWLLYSVIRHNPRRWWLTFWVMSAPIVVFLLFVAPVLIEPAFHRFDPLLTRHPELAGEIQKVVKHGGLDIPPSHLFEMNASEKMNSVNAYVTGIGASKRVVVFDNTIARMETPHILVIFGHEMGHYVLGHTWLKIGFTCSELLVVLICGYLALDRTIRRWGKTCGIRGIDDWASFPCFMLAFAVFSFLAEPLQISFRRTLEH